MTEADRRLGHRIDLDLFLNSVVSNRPMRALAANVSTTGMYLEIVRGALPANDNVQQLAIEFQLPGQAESIWALAEICYRSPGSLVEGVGIRFVAMPQCHARMLRDFCVDARIDHLDTLLDMIRQPVAA